MANVFENSLPVNWGEGREVQKETFVLCCCQYYFQFLEYVMEIYHLMHEFWKAYLLLFTSTSTPPFLTQR